LEQVEQQELLELHRRQMVQIQYLQQLHHLAVVAAMVATEHLVGQVAVLVLAVAVPLLAVAAQLVKVMQVVIHLTPLLPMEQVAVAELLE
jgi:hypothetical protein